MATDRQMVCAYYICLGSCEKGRNASHRKYCQRCDKYKPRAKGKYKNKKKEELDKIRKREMRDCE